VTDRLTITVPGEPQSQDRRTRQLRAKDGRQFAGTYLLTQTRKWREAILFAARRHPDFPREPWELCTGRVGTSCRLSGLVPPPTRPGEVRSE